MTESIPFGYMWAADPRKGIRVRPGEDLTGEDPPRPVIRIGDLGGDPIGLIFKKGPGPVEKLQKASWKSDDPEAEGSDDPTVKAGDLVIVISGSTLRCAVADETNAGCVISQNLVAVSLKKGYSPYYVCWYLNSTHGQHQLAQYSKGSSITRSITINSLRQVEIPLLPQGVRKDIHALFAGFHRHERRLVEEREEMIRIMNEIVRRAQEGTL